MQYEAFNPKSYQYIHIFIYGGKHRTKLNTTLTLDSINDPQLSLMDSKFAVP